MYLAGLALGTLPSMADPGITFHLFRQPVTHRANLAVFPLTLLRLSAHALLDGPLLTAKGKGFLAALEPGTGDPPLYGGSWDYIPARSGNQSLTGPMAMSLPSA